MSMTTSTDGGRERELEDLGVTDPTVEWLDNDRVLVSMRRTELDQLIAGDMHHPDALDHDCGDFYECDCDVDGARDEGHEDGYAEALADIRALAEGAA